MGATDDPDVLGAAPRSRSRALPLEADCARRRLAGRRRARCWPASAAPPRATRPRRRPTRMRDAGLDGVQTVEDDDELWDDQRAAQRASRRRVAEGLRPRMTDLAAAIRAADAAGGGARRRAPRSGCRGSRSTPATSSGASAASATRSTRAPRRGAGRPGRAAARARPVGRARRRRARRDAARQGALRHRAHLPSRRLRGRHLMALIDLVDGAWDEQPPARPRADPGLRALRLLPADVPELPRLRGGDGLAARADRADARRPRGGRRDLRRDGHALRPLPRLHGVRDRLPVGRPVRPADRADAAADRAPRRPAAARARATGARSSRCSPTRAACARSRRCSRSSSSRASTTRSPKLADPEARSALLALAPDVSPRRRRPAAAGADARRAGSRAAASR